MKKTIILSLLLAGTTLICRSQSVFTVQPGLQLTGFSYGTQSGSSRWIAGFQYLGLSEKYTDKFDNSTNEFRISVLMPYVGLKQEISTNNDLMTYGKVLLIKPLIFEKDTGLDTDLGLWAGELGIGTEYRFAEQFSIGGEVGLRMGTGRSESENFKDSIFAQMLYSAVTLNFHFNKKGPGTDQ